jgi:hypothetical protein
LDIKNVTEADHLRLMQMIGLVNAASFGPYSAKTIVEKGEMIGKMMAESKLALEWFKALAVQVQAELDRQASEKKISAPESAPAVSASVPAAAAGGLAVKSYNPGKFPSPKRRK